MVVVQDVRGRYTSEGEWYTFKHEIDDGYDTVEWAAALPHSNGKVGMFGGSYVGATQMLAAIGHPPHLAGICPVVTASATTTKTGPTRAAPSSSGSTSRGPRASRRTPRIASSANDTNALVGDRVLPLRDFPVFNIKPVASGSQLTHELAPYFLDWLAHPTYDSYWKQWSIEENYAEHSGPRADDRRLVRHLPGRISAQLCRPARRTPGMKQHANGQRLLVIAIGGHAGSGRKIGEVDFGAGSSGVRRGRGHARLVRLPVSGQAEPVCVRRIQ